MSENHHWPKRQTEHVWGKWLSKSRSVMYRTCVHPDCDAVEERPAATI